MCVSNCFSYLGRFMIWSVRYNMIPGQFGFARCWLLINTLMYGD